MPIDHFGYNTTSKYGYSSNATFYFIIGGDGKNIYPILYPEFEEYWRFTPEDFYLLTNDDTVSKIFDNSQFTAFQII